ncbi:DUF309 domain-containing protein [Priestia megaterium]|uniref:DUF309 domain-containing protein n=1 Tax=Priestia megaterium TaxID=1404 RepID=UPI00372CF83F
MYSQAYIDYLVHFHGDRDYFECHELLEEHWKKDERGHRSIIWVGLIQIAVSLYHHRRQNFAGAKRTMQKALAILTKEEENIAQLGLNYPSLFKLLRKQLALIDTYQPYKSINLPIEDPALLRACKQRSTDKQLVWLSASNLQNDAIVHRHSTRDRSDVIAERQANLLAKQNNR